MNFDENTINLVWKKGQAVQGNDPNVFRKDECGAWIARSSYGDREAKFGWEIDHINPDGGDQLQNLQPLHWKNNVAKGDGPLTCAVTSSGITNV